LNSIGAEEWGNDYGDYFLATGARVEYRRGLGARAEWSAAGGREETASLPARAQPAGRGPMRPNPVLGGPGVSFLEVAFRRKSEGFAVRRDQGVSLTLEGGRVDGGDDYLRLAGAGHILFPLGPTRGLLWVQAGYATADLPAHRSFVLGGRGTLLGEAFRRWGGRRLVVAHAEWRVPVPFVSFAAGPYTRTPRSLIVAPFAAVGWSERAVPGTPWVATPGALETVGLALEWLGVVRVEAGVGAQSRRLALAIDVTRDFWDIL
jgi:hypothetical protein